MLKILMILAHPALEKSRNNVGMLRAAEHIEGLVVRDLYELYPRFFINTKKEQELLSQSNVIVLQHPFYWYSAPALMKQYLDMVFTYNWAYGKNGQNLKGKIMFNSLTTGGSRDSYHEGKHNRFPLANYLLPFAQMASVCGMCYLPPFVLHQSGKIFAAEASRHAKHLEALLTLFAKGNFDLEAMMRCQYLNDYSLEPTNNPNQ
ncbi:MAG: NAD(P)H-dependent oxidoreductase [Edaphocola sp.]